MFLWLSDFGCGFWLCETCFLLLKIWKYFANDAMITTSPKFQDFQSLQLPYQEKILDISLGKASSELSISPKKKLYERNSYVDISIGYLSICWSKSFLINLENFVNFFNVFTWLHTNTQQQKGGRRKQIGKKINNMLLFFYYFRIATIEKKYLCIPPCSFISPNLYFFDWVCFAYLTSSSTELIITGFLAFAVEEKPRKKTRTAIFTLEKRLILLSNFIFRAIFHLLWNYREITVYIILDSPFFNKDHFFFFSLSFFFSVYSTHTKS